MTLIQAHENEAPLSPRSEARPGARPSCQTNSRRSREPRCWPWPQPPFQWRDATSPLAPPPDDPSVQCGSAEAPCCPRRHRFGSAESSPARKPPGSLCGCPPRRSSRARPTSTPPRSPRPVWSNRRNRSAHLAYSSTGTGGGMPGGDLDLSDVGPGVGHGCDEGVPQHAGASVAAAQPQMAAGPADEVTVARGRAIGNLPMANHQLELDQIGPITSETPFIIPIHGDFL